jgi:hypothetical protein
MRTVEGNWLSDRSIGAPLLGNAAACFLPVRPCVDHHHKVDRRVASAFSRPEGAPLRTAREEKRPDGQWGGLAAEPLVELTKHDADESVVNSLVLLRSARRVFHFVDVGHELLFKSLVESRKL